LISAPKREPKASFLHQATGPQGQVSNAGEQPAGHLQLVEAMSRVDCLPNFASSHRETNKSLCSVGSLMALFLGGQAI
jgi:hypothetical protein